MDIFCFIVLEDTLEKLTNRPMLHDRHSRLAECVTVVRACMDLMALNPENREYKNRIRQPLIELAGIARRNGAFIIAWRLTMILHQLSLSGNVRHLAKTA